MKIRIKYRFLFFAVLLSALLTSCIKEEYSNIENSLVVSSTYSLPIGKSSLTMEDVFLDSNFDIDTTPLNTTDVSDTTFSYNDKLYGLPTNALFDTIINEVYDFSSLQELIDYAVYIMFRVNLENGIPSEILCQLSFLDENKNELFSLFDSPGIYLNAANSEGNYLLSPYDTNPLTQNQIQSLTQTRFIRVRIQLNIQSSDTGVKYYSSQDLNIQMGVRIGVEKRLSE